MQEYEEARIQSACIVPFTFSKCDKIFFVMVDLESDSYTNYEISFFLNQDEIRDCRKIRDRCLENGWQLFDMYKDLENETSVFLNLLVTSSKSEDPILFFKDELSPEFCESINAKVEQVREFLKMIKPIWTKRAAERPKFPPV